MFWGAYRSYKLLKPVFAEDGTLSPSSGEASARSLRKFTEVYDSTGGRDLLVFWVVWSFLSVWETTGGETLSSVFVPFYFEMKMAVLLSVAFPSSPVISIAFERVIRPGVVMAENYWNTRAKGKAYSYVITAVRRTYRLVFQAASQWLHKDELKGWKADMRRNLKRVKTELAARADAATLPVIRAPGPSAPEMDVPVAAPTVKQSAAPSNGKSRARSANEPESGVSGVSSDGSSDDETYTSLLPKHTRASISYGAMESILGRTRTPRKGRRETASTGTLPNVEVRHRRSRRGSSGLSPLTEHPPAGDFSTPEKEPIIL
jgi:hypothetical protein